MKPVIIKRDGCRVPFNGMRIIEAVANHHQPQRVPQYSFDVLAAVYLANLLVQETTEPNLPGRQSPDPTYLESLGITPAQLTEWRELALEQAQPPKE